MPVHRPRAFLSVLWLILLAAGCGSPATASSPAEPRLSSHGFKECLPLHLTFRHKPRMDVSALQTSARPIHIQLKTPLRGYRQAAFYLVPLINYDTDWGRVAWNMAGCLSRFDRPLARIPVRSGLFAWDGTYPRSFTGGSLIIVLGRGTYYIEPIAWIG